MARLDTHWHNNPKVLRLGLAAMGLHAWSISYCDSETTDGFIPSAALPNMGGVRQATHVLLESGRWLATEGGYLLHDYLAYNRSRAEILEDRAKSAARQEAYRRRNGAAESTARPVAAIMHQPRDVTHNHAVT
jgi:hypothetical protein